MFPTLGGSDFPSILKNEHLLSALRLTRGHAQSRAELSCTERGWEAGREGPVSIVSAPSAHVLLTQQSPSGLPLGISRLECCELAECGFSETLSNEGGGGRLKPNPQHQLSIKSRECAAFQSNTYQNRLLMGSLQGTGPSWWYQELIQGC